MELGVCCGPDEIAVLDALGYDFIEVNATNVSQLSDAAFELFRNELARYRIPVKTSNCFYPGEMRLVGEGVDLDGIDQYVDHTMNRLKQLGVEDMVFGSGKSRRFEEPLTYRVAFVQLLNVCRIMETYAAKYGLRVLIEPLNRSETNWINSVAEGSALAAAVNSPHFGVIADFYHMMTEGEPFSDLKRLAPLEHIHIATADRMIPTQKEEMAKFIGVLNDLKYQGRVSIEGGSQDFRSEASLALNHFRLLTS